MPRNYQKRGRANFLAQKKVVRLMNPSFQLSFPILFFSLALAVTTRRDRYVCTIIASVILTFLFRPNSSRLVFVRLRGLDVLLFQHQIRFFIHANLFCDVCALLGQTIPRCRKYGPCCKTLHVVQKKCRGLYEATKDMCKFLTKYYSEEIYGILMEKSVD